MERLAQACRVAGRRVEDHEGLAGPGHIVEPVVISKKMHPNEKTRCPFASTFAVLCLQPFSVLHYFLPDRRIGSSPLISLQWLLDSIKSSQPSMAQGHLAIKPGVTSQLLVSCGSPQIMRPLRPAVTSSSSRPVVAARSLVGWGSETVIVRGVPCRSRVGVALMSSPMRSCSSSQWSNVPSRMMRLSRTRGKGKRLIQ